MSKPDAYQVRQDGKPVYVCELPGVAKGYIGGRAGFDTFPLVAIDDETRTGLKIALEAIREVENLKPVAQAKAVAALERLIGEGE